MKVTRRTDYAIHLIADLANAPGESLGLRALAERHGVTYAFARTVQQGLLKAGIIRSARGINGGITLAKDLKDITLLEVFEAAQDSVESIFDTEETPWCSCEGECKTDHIWDKATEVVRDHFRGITLHHVLHHGQ
jgi:Rrf2 family protein